MSETCRTTAPNLARFLGASLLCWSAFTSTTAARAEPQPNLPVSLAVAHTGTAGPERPPGLGEASPLIPATPLVTADGKLRALGYEPTNIRDAIAAYRAGRLDAGDALVAPITNPQARAALEWVALRSMPLSTGLDRLYAFIASHPDWAAPNALRYQVEARLLQVRDPAAVLRFFATRAPSTAVGKLALAKALKQTGRVADGTKLARATFREHDLSAYLEGVLRADFGGDLTRGDYKYRADRLVYRGSTRWGLQYAALAGGQVVALENARIRPTDAAIASLPEALRSDPGLILAQVHQLRHAKKLITAAKLLQTVTDPSVPQIDPDGWWTERRVLARELLDANKPNAAYITCAMHGHGSRETDVEAEFHAGWIALRFMHEPQRAAYHFWVAAKQAEGPTEIARIAYWRGRTAEASDDPQVIVQAKAFYTQAAAHNSAYYGQLARKALGLPAEIVQAPTIAAIGNDRAETIRIIELLYAAGEKESASVLAFEAAQTFTDQRQIAALAAVIADQQNANLSLTVGKLIGQRGISVDPLAFPAFGIPEYRELANSAALPVVYAVARQESAFITRAVSGAHANGLMQMLDGTARQTALKAGLPFSHARLLQDAAFNAQLGASHLGTLMSEHDGSLMLTFAAYNAGGGRVKDWIDAYGDPRKPGVDPVDWVERIPFTETRYYVQRVMANVGVYQAIFAEKAKRDTIAKRDREARL